MKRVYNRAHWGWFDRLLFRLIQRWWVPRVHRLLANARELGHLDSWLWHELDHRLKYEPWRPWTYRDATNDGVALEASARRQP